MIAAVLQLLARLLSFSGGVVVGALAILALMVFVVWVGVTIADAMEQCDRDYEW